MKVLICRIRALVHQNPTKIVTMKDHGVNPCKNIRKGPPLKGKL